MITVNTTVSTELGSTVSAGHSHLGCTTALHMSAAGDTALPGYCRVYSAA
jgi:hypothetical protein